MGSSISFEVMGYRDGHWTISFITDSREEAIAEAKNAEAGRHVQAVKVVKETTDDETGEEHSNVIYSGGITDGIPDSKGAKKLYQRKAGLKDRAHTDDAEASEQEKGEPELHPERVTNLIDNIRLSVIVFGAVGLLFVVLAFSYISNPDAISNLLDRLFE